MTETIFQLTPSFFSERVLVEHGPLSASAFRYDSGVCALRLKNELGELVMLPFLGQQIRSAELGGRNLTMRSMFNQPNPTRAYLETYGGFLIHCGATAMGVPMGPDTHSLHGELSNAPCRKAWLAAGEDARGAYLALGGAYARAVAFNAHRPRQIKRRLSADGPEPPGAGSRPAHRRLGVRFNHQYCGRHPARGLRRDDPGGQQVRQVRGVMCLRR